MADALPAPTGDALRAAAGDEAADLEVLLKDRCGIGYLEAGSLLAAYWQLPAAFTNGAYAECLAVAGSLNRLSGVICSGSRLSHRVRREAAGGDAESSASLEQPSASGGETADWAGLLDRLRTQREHIEGLAEQLCS